jgi:hypothetical protein
VQRRQVPLPASSAPLAVMQWAATCGRGVVCSKSRAEAPPQARKAEVSSQWSPACRRFEPRHLTSQAIQLNSIQHVTTCPHPFPFLCVCHRVLQSPKFEF